MRVRRTGPVRSPPADLATSADDAEASLLHGLELLRGLEQAPPAEPPARPPEGEGRHGDRPPLQFEPGVDERASGGAEGHGAEGQDDHLPLGLRPVRGHHLPALPEDLHLVGEPLLLQRLDGDVAGHPEEYHVAGEHHEEDGGRRDLRHGPERVTPVPGHDVLAHGEAGEAGPHEHGHGAGRDDLPCHLGELLEEPAEGRADEKRIHVDLAEVEDVLPVR